MGRPSDSPDRALAKALRQLRTESGLTQEDLAHKAGITTTTLARIEGGATNPSWTTVRRITAALDVTLQHLGNRVDAAS